MRGELASTIVQLLKSIYGRGPIAARAYLNDQFVVVVCRDGLTPAELALIASGRSAQAQSMRADLQQIHSARFREAVQAITGRVVLDHCSMLTLEPMRLVELFVLDEPIVDLTQPAQSAEAAQP